MGNDEGGQKEGINWFGFFSCITWGIMFWLKWDKYFLNKDRCIWRLSLLWNLMVCISTFLEVYTCLHFYHCHLGVILFFHPFLGSWSLWPSVSRLAFLWVLFCILKCYFFQCGHMHYSKNHIKQTFKKKVWKGERR